MRLLLTNDDGIDAEGLAALEAAMARFGTVRVVAPLEPSSGCGHQVTAHRPLRVATVAPHRLAVDGSPADCVRLGLLYLATDSQWLISGINAGGNLGVDLHMSGTVAAAREAALMGLPAMAISQYRARGSRFDWPKATELAARAFDQLRDLPLEKRSFWNVNLPDLEGEPGTPPLVICEPDRHPLAIAYEQRDGHFHYCGVYQDRKYLTGTDVDHCFRGQVTASKVSCDVAVWPVGASDDSSSRREI